MVFSATFIRDAYSVPYLVARVKEAQVQRAVLQILAAKHIPAVSVDVGGKDIRGRAFGALKRAGRPDLTHLIAGKTGAGIAGVVDIIGVIPGKFLGPRWGVPLFLEMKAPAWYSVSDKTGKLIQIRAAGKLTPQQEQFLTTMGEAGAVVGVCWSAADLKKIFSEIGLEI